MEWAKTIHVSCVILSFSGFLLRGIWMMFDSTMLTNKWVKVVPHIVDTALLLSAIFLVYSLDLSVLNHDWLLAKIIALIAYVLIGTVALKRGKTKKIKMTALFLAMIVFLYIVSVAMTKSAIGFMSVL